MSRLSFGWLELEKGLYHLETSMLLRTHSLWLDFNGAGITSAKEETKS
jgi:hypothetical protein